MDVLESWKIHVVKRDNKERPLFSGFVGNQKVLFFAAGFDHITESIISESTNKHYKLGIAHPEYEKNFPNAKNKLLKKLRENRKK
jgi:hypothetical protein